MEASRATVGMSSAGKVDGAGRQLRSRRMFSYSEKACARLCRLPPAASSQIDTGALDDPVDMLAASSTSGPKRQEPVASAPPAKKAKGKAGKGKQKVGGGGKGSSAASSLSVPIVPPKAPPEVQAWIKNRPKGGVKVLSGTEGSLGKRPAEGDAPEAPAAKK